MNRAIRVAVLAVLTAMLAGCVVAPAPAPYYGGGYGYYGGGYGYYSGYAPGYVYGPPVGVGFEFGEHHHHWR